MSAFENEDFNLEEFAPLLALQNKQTPITKDRITTKLKSNKTGFGSSQYDKNTSPEMFESAAAVANQRHANQSAYNYLYAPLKLATDAGGHFLGAAGGLAEGLYHRTGIDLGEDVRYNNKALEWSEGILNWGQETMPIYQPHTSGHFESFGTLAGTINNLSGIGSSAIGYMGGMALIAAGIGLASPYLIGAATAVGVPSAIAAGTVGLGATALSANLAAISEGVSTGNQVKKEIYNEKVRKGVSHEEAEKISNAARETAVHTNALLNTSLNMIGAGTIYSRAAKATASRFGTSQLVNQFNKQVSKEVSKEFGDVLGKVTSKTISKADDVASRMGKVKEGIQAINEKELAKTGGKSFFERNFTVAGEAFQEGLEELNNQYSERLAKERAKQNKKESLKFNNPLSSQFYEGLNELEDYAKHTFNEEGAFNFLLGAIGGAGTKLVTDLFNSKNEATLSEKEQAFKMMKSNFLESFDKAIDLRKEYESVLEAEANKPDYAPIAAKRKREIEDEMFDTITLSNALKDGTEGNLEKFLLHIEKVDNKKDILGLAKEEYNKALSESTGIASQLQQQFEEVEQLKQQGQVIEGTESAKVLFDELNTVLQSPITQDGFSIEQFIEKKEDSQKSEENRLKQSQDIYNKLKQYRNTISELQQNEATAQYAEGLSNLLNSVEKKTQAELYQNKRNQLNRLFNTNSDEMTEAEYFDLASNKDDNEYVNRSKNHQQKLKEAKNIYDSLKSKLVDPELPLNKQLDKVAAVNKLYDDYQVALISERKYTELAKKTKAVYDGMTDYEFITNQSLITNLENISSTIKSLPEYQELSDLEEKVIGEDENSEISLWIKKLDSLKSLSDITSSQFENISSELSSGLGIQIEPNTNSINNALQIIDERLKLDNESLANAEESLKKALSKTKLETNAEGETIAQENQVPQETIDALNNDIKQLQESVTKYKNLETKAKNIGTDTVKNEVDVIKKTANIVLSQIANISPRTKDGKVAISPKAKKAIEKVDNAINKLFERTLKQGEEEIDADTQVQKQQALQELNELKSEYDKIKSQLDIAEDNVDVIADMYKGDINDNTIYESAINTVNELKRKAQELQSQAQRKSPETLSELRNIEKTANLLKEKIQRYDDLRKQQIQNLESEIKEREFSGVTMQTLENAADSTYKTDEIFGQTKNTVDKQLGRLTPEEMNEVGYMLGAIKMDKVSGRQKNEVLKAFLDAYKARNVSLKNLKELKTNEAIKKALNDISESNKKDIENYVNSITKLAEDRLNLLNKVFGNILGRKVKAVSNFINGVSDEKQANKKNKQDGVKNKSTSDVKKNPNTQKTKSVDLINPDSYFIASENKDGIITESIFYKTVDGNINRVGNEVDESDINIDVNNLIPSDGEFYLLDLTSENMSPEIVEIIAKFNEELNEYGINTFIKQFLSDEEVISTKNEVIEKLNDFSINTRLKHESTKQQISQIASAYTKALYKIYSKSKEAINRNSRLSQEQKETAIKNLNNALDKTSFYLTGSVTENNKQLYLNKKTGTGYYSKTFDALDKMYPADDNRIDKISTKINVSYSETINGVEHISITAMPAIDVSKETSDIIEKNPENIFFKGVNTINFRSVAELAKLLAKKLNNESITNGEFVLVNKYYQQNDSLSNNYLLVPVSENMYLTGNDLDYFALKPETKITYKDSNVEASFDFKESKNSPGIYYYDITITANGKTVNFSNDPNGVSDEIREGNEKAFLGIVNYLRELDSSEKESHQPIKDLYSFRSTPMNKSDALRFIMELVDVNAFKEDGKGYKPVYDKNSFEGKVNENNLSFEELVEKALKVDAPVEIKKMWENIFNRFNELNKGNNPYKLNIIESRPNATASVNPNKRIISIPKNILFSNGINEAQIVFHELSHAVDFLLQNDSEYKTAKNNLLKAVNEFIENKNKLFSGKAFTGEGLYHNRDLLTYLRNSFDDSFHNNDKNKRGLELVADMFSNFSISPMIYAIAKATGRENDYNKFADLLLGEGSSKTVQGYIQFNLGVKEAADTSAGAEVVNNNKSKESMIQQVADGFAFFVEYKGISYIVNDNNEIFSFHLNEVVDWKNSYYLKKRLILEKEKVKKKLILEEEKVKNNQINNLEKEIENLGSEFEEIEGEFEEIEVQNKINEIKKQKKQSDLNKIKKPRKDIKVKPEIQKQENDITDEEYNNFIDTGIISEDILNLIANKIKNNKQLNEKEVVIFNDKTAEINEILRILAEKEISKTKPETDEELNLKKTKEPEAKPKPVFNTQNTAPIIAKRKLANITQSPEFNSLISKKTSASNTIIITQDEYRELLKSNPEAQLLVKSFSVDGIEIYTNPFDVDSNIFSDDNSERTVVLKQINKDYENAIQSVLRGENTISEVFIGFNKDIMLKDDAFKGLHDYLTKHSTSQPSASDGWIAVKIGDNYYYNKVRFSNPSINTNINTIHTVTEWELFGGTLADNGLKNKLNPEKVEISNNNKSSNVKIIGSSLKERTINPANGSAYIIKGDSYATVHSEFANNRDVLKKLFEKGDFKTVFEKYFYTKSIKKSKDSYFFVKYINKKPNIVYKENSDSDEVVTKVFDNDGNFSEEFFNLMSSKKYNITEENKKDLIENNLIYTNAGDVNIDGVNYTMLKSNFNAIEMAEKIDLDENIEDVKIEKPKKRKKNKISLEDAEDAFSPVISQEITPVKNISSIFTEKTIEAQKSKVEQQKRICK